MNQYPNSGTLFTRDKKNPKAADYGGDMTIDAEVLQYLLAKARNGEEVKLELSGWRRQGRNNTNFISLKVDIPYSERQNRTGQGQGVQGGRQYSRPYPDERPPIQTSRGQYDRGGFEQGRQQAQFRQELNDEIPFGKPPARDNSPPWE